MVGDLLTNFTLPKWYDALVIDGVENFAKSCFQLSTISLRFKHLQEPLVQREDRYLT